MEAFWPYLVVLLVGALPNGIFRAAAVLLSRGLDPDSEFFAWIRVVAIALLAAVVSKIVITRPASLALYPGWLPLLAMASGIAAFYLTGRRLLAAILAGEAVFVLAAWWLGGA